MWFVFFAFISQLMVAFLTGLHGVHAANPVEEEHQSELVSVILRLRLLVEILVLARDSKVKIATSTSAQVRLCVVASNILLHSLILSLCLLTLQSHNQINAQRLVNANCSSSSSCQVDGGWSRWTSWTVCNKTCGGGQQFRTRRCDSPAPSNSGNPCLGPKTENRACNDFTCSGKKTCFSWFHRISVMIGVSQVVPCVRQNCSLSQLPNTEMSFILFAYCFPTQ